MYGYIYYYNDHYGEIKIPITKAKAWHEIDELPEWQLEEYINGCAKSALKVLREQAPATSDGGIKKSLKKMLTILLIPLEIVLPELDELDVLGTSITIHSDSDKMRSVCDKVYRQLTEILTGVLNK